MLFNIQDTVEAADLESLKRIQAAQAAQATLASSELGKSDIPVPEPPETPGPVTVPLSEQEETEILNALSEVLESESLAKKVALEASSVQPTPQPLLPPAPDDSSGDPPQAPLEKKESAGGASACGSEASASQADNAAMGAFFDPKTYKGRTVGLPPVGPPHVMTELTQDNINRFFSPSTYQKNLHAQKNLGEGDDGGKDTNEYKPTGHEALNSAMATPVATEMPHGPHSMEVEVDVAVAGQSSSHQAQPETTWTGRNPGCADGEQGDCSLKPDTCPDTLIDVPEGQTQTQEVPVPGPHSADRSQKPAAPEPFESAKQEIPEHPQVPQAAQSSEVQEDLAVSAQLDQPGFCSASAASSSSKVTGKQNSNAKGSSSGDQSSGPSAVRNRGMVKSLDECMKFWEDCLFKLDESDEIQSLMSNLQDDTFSTAFSGQFAHPLFQKLRFTDFVLLLLLAVFLKQ